MVYFWLVFSLFKVWLTDKLFSAILIRTLILASKSTKEPEKEVKQ